METDASSQGEAPLVHAHSSERRRPLFVSLRNTKSAVHSAPIGGSVSRGDGAGTCRAIEKEAAAQYAAVDRFLAELPRRSGIEPRCIAFLLDGDRYAIYDPRIVSPIAD